MITVILTEQEARCLVSFAKRGCTRVLCASARKREALRLTRLKKQYSEQKNLDAVCLAANGNRSDLLSGEAGRLRHAVYSLQLSQQWRIEAAEIAYAVTERIKSLMPKKEEGGEV